MQTRHTSDINTAQTAAFGRTILVYGMELLDGAAIGRAAILSQPYSNGEAAAKPA
jgi:hypothetical protein